MDIAFSHMFEGCEYKIVVSRGSDPYVCQFRLKDGPGRYDYIKEDCLAVRSGLQHFNSMGGNERDWFYSLLEIEGNIGFIGIARIIGITSAFGHYFEVFSSPSALKGFLAESFIHLRESVFIDWDAVSSDDSNQVIYIPDPETIDKHKSEISQLYRDGKAGEIAFGKDGTICYWFESKDLDVPFRPELEAFREELVLKANGLLRSKFPSK